VARENYNDSYDYAYCRNYNYCSYGTGEIIFTGAMDPKCNKPGKNAYYCDENNFPKYPEPSQGSSGSEVTQSDVLLSLSGDYNESYDYEYCRNYNYCN